MPNDNSMFSDENTSCWVDPDYDYDGNDITCITNTTPGDCCSECNKNSQCAYYSWLNNPPKYQNMCCLKTSNSGRIYEKGHISGMKRKDSPTCQRDVDYDYRGNDVELVYNITNPGDCCIECNNNPSCLYFSWLNVPPTFTNTCCLKSSSTGRVYSKGHVSGMKVRDVGDKLC